MAHKWGPGMPSTIGVRIYKFDFRQRGSRSPLAFDSALMAKHPKSFIEEFTKQNATPTQDSEAERSWYFERRQSNDSGILEVTSVMELLDLRATLSTRKQKPRNIKEQLQMLKKYHYSLIFGLPPDLSLA
jgi:hypothetical protein